MSNLFDYIDWRGDLTFGNAPICAVDALIFSMLAYVSFEGLVPSDPHAEPIRLSEAISAYLKRPAVTPRRIDEHHEGLLRVLQSTARFGALRVLAAKKVLDRESGMQFGAISFLLPGQNLFVAFEGTDDTLIGWQEDFRMSYECPVPAQLAAAKYLGEVAGAHPMRRVITGGHSKGGNLAMYAAVYGGDAITHRIRTVYNFDGPGFCDGTLASPAYLEMRERIKTFLPQSSIVAVLLEHDTNYKIVRSSNKGILQHDGYSWEVMGNDFVYTTERTAFGQRTESVIDNFINSTSPQRRRRFTEALFGILAATEQDTVSGILGGKRRSLRSIISAYSDLPDEVRVLLNETMAVFNKGQRAARKQGGSQALPNAEKSS